MRLSELKVNQSAKIIQIHHLNNPAGADPIAIRLVSLGFVSGEKVEIMTRSLFGGDPILVKIGFARFALRRAEADRIEIEI